MVPEEGGSAARVGVLFALHFVAAVVLIVVAAAAASVVAPVVFVAASAAVVAAVAFSARFPEVAPFVVLCVVRSPVGCVHRALSLRTGQQ